MYSGIRQNQTNGYGSNTLGEEPEHKGTVISISVPFHELDLIEEMDLQARMECCSSRSHYFRRLIRRGKAERLKAEKQHAEWSSVWGHK
jgi:metal-responsive CopG/Arc/MetJ family transcriptional regulator